MPVPALCKECTEDFLKVHAGDLEVNVACVVYRDDPWHWKRMLDAKGCPYLWQRMVEITEEISPEVEAEIESRRR